MTTYTHCVLCEQYCGLAVETANGKVIDIRPDKQNPYSWRDFCIKGGLSHLSLDHPNRITRPMRRVGDRFVEATYEEAIADIAERLNRIVAEHGPDAVASYAGNPTGFNIALTIFYGMLLDAIGTRNRIWPGSIDSNAWFMAADRMFGNYFCALQTDIDHSDYMLFIGSNPKISAMSWVGRIPDGWKRALQAQKRGAKIVMVDPRRTESARKADLHIAPLPESDWAFVLGLIKVIFERDLCNRTRFDRITGIELIESVARMANLADLSARCDVPEQTIVDTAIEFAEAKRAFAVSRTGVTVGRNGGVGLWLTYVLNALTNRIDAEGGLYYASGNVIDFLQLDGVFPPKPPRFHSRVRKLPSVMGYIALAELPDEINTPGPGQVRAMLMVAGNPVVTGPEGDALDGALSKLDLFVAVDQFQRESHRHAHWLIPGEHFLERDDTVDIFMAGFNPVPYVQATRKAVDRPAGMIAEWQFYRDLILAMDRPLVKGKSKLLNLFVKATIQLSKLTGNPAHSFSPNWIIKPLVKMGGRFQWKDIMAAEHGIGDVNARPKFHLFDLLATRDKKLHIAPQEFVDELKKLLAPPGDSAGLFPLHLISRRRMHMMNSWLGETSMTQDKDSDAGGRIEVNPADAAQFGLRDGQPVVVESAVGRVNAVVQVSDDIRSGAAVMEQCWGSRRFDPRDPSRVESNGGVNRNLLVSNRDLDPLTGVPRLNGTPIRIAPASEQRALDYLKEGESSR